MKDKTKLGLIIAGLVVAVGALLFSVKQSFFAGPAPVPQSRGPEYGERMKQQYRATADRFRRSRAGGGNPAPR